MTKQLRHLQMLQDLATRSGIRAPWVHNSLFSLQIHWSEPLYAVVARHILATVEEIKLIDMAFVKPEDQLDLCGELELGTIMGGERLRLRIPQNSLSRHGFVAGSAGFGKTIFALCLAEKVLVSDTATVRITDPKADEFIPLAKKVAKLTVLSYSEMRFNLFTPPPRVPVCEWLQIVVSLLAECFNFWESAQSMLLKTVNWLHDNGRPANVREILRVLNSWKGFGAKDAQTIVTLKSRLELLDNALGEVISTDSEMLTALHDQSCIISTGGLMPQIESLLSEFLLVWEFMYRKYNPHKRSQVLFIYDEAQHRVLNAAKERGGHALAAPLISMLVDQARALNIGICSLAQEPSTVIRAALNNAYMRVAFRLGSGSETKVIKEAMALTEDQADCLHYLEPGEAIVRMAGGYMDAFPVKFDEFDSTPCMTDQEFQKHQTQLKDRLFQESVSSNSVQTHLHHTGCTKPTEPLPNESTLTPPRRKRGDNNLPSVAETREPNSRTEVDASQRLLSVWLNLDDPRLTQGELFERVEIRSGSKQARIKKSLLGQGWIQEHKLQVGKTYVSIWEPLDKAYESAGVKKPRLKSKGGYLHQFIAHRIKKRSEANGYNVEVESMLTNGKSIDLVLRKPGEIVFVEIAVSPPLEKEISNLIKDLAAELVPDRLLIVTVDGKAKRRLEELVALDSRLDKARDRIEVKLAGDFI